MTRPVPIWSGVCHPSISVSLPRGMRIRDVKKYSTSLGKLATGPLTCWNWLTCLDISSTILAQNVSWVALGAMIVIKSMSIIIVLWAHRPPIWQNSRNAILTVRSLFWKVPVQRFIRLDRAQQVCVIALLQIDTSHHGCGLSSVGAVWAEAASEMLPGGVTLVVMDGALRSPDVDWVSDVNAQITLLTTYVVCFCPGVWLEARDITVVLAEHLLERHENCAEQKSMSEYGIRWMCCISMQFTWQHEYRVLLFYFSYSRL